MAAIVSLWARQTINSDVDSVTSDVNGVKTTFSTWDNCMTKSYCKWPAIIGIIIASVIVISIIWCLARCLCCGLECCCGCFSCFNRCCPSGRGRRPPRSSKYADPIEYPAPYQGYQPSPALPPYSSQQPQYAHFDAGGKRGAAGGEDSLPVMPSWDTASTRRIPDPKNEDVELGRLGPNEEHTAPLVANQAPAPTGGFGGEGLPYQQYGAYHGGDLGAPYRGVDPPAPAASHGYPQQGYSAYTPSQSTRYEPSEQELPTTYNSRDSVPAQRRPLENSWRDV